MKNTGLKRVDNSLKPLLKKGVEKKIFSGAAVGIYHITKTGENRLIQTYGKTRNDEFGLSITANTFFDLASLTKPLCTVLSILCLIEQNKINLHTRLDDILNYRLPKQYRDIPVHQLLSHSSGLTAYKPFYKSFQAVLNKKNKQRIVQAILDDKLEYKPISKCVYSDFGYILLGEIIETVSGLDLDIFFKKEIAGPLDLEKKIQFRPIAQFMSKPTINIAATERCPWRRKVMQGEVHDEHSWLMNGVAGHAGLFGSITGVLSFTEQILNQWRGRATHPGYSNELLQKALSRQYSDQTWCLGFDTPSLSGSSAGRYMSRNSVGHLGYTGTSFWIDPEMGLVVVLLTNRVHPTRHNEKIKEFRPLFHDTVITSLNRK